MAFCWFLGFLVIFGVLAYQRAALKVWTLAYGLFLIFFIAYSPYSTTTVSIFSGLYLLIFAPFNITPWRRRFISRRLLQFYVTRMPHLSRTESEALAAGTVTFEGDLFQGNPDWQKLLSIPRPQLSAEETAFLAGPVETLCSQIKDWEIIQQCDLPPELWHFIKKHGFFGLIIPKQYGGKEFSAYAHARILSKISSVSTTVAVTVSVPNSLGPAELLLHYGTPAQKNYYLPKLATGEEIPCFALTSPDAGSDASAMTDYGKVCWGEMNGEKTLGIQLNWSKRYITLAPIATVIGLAFKLYDPDHLLGDNTEIGITCALIPRNTPGIHIGRRHWPLYTPFQNGPIQGKNVFIPLDCIIGGPAMAGKGWVMLMECLAAGRAISLPNITLGSAKALCYATSAYARIRKQFNLPIGRFEGIQEPLARFAVYNYIMDAASTLTTGMIDLGEKPAVASAIIKYHVTELGRKAALDAMDIHGGKAICMGPKNYVGKGYISSPIAITVEGANILTRNMIILGQGAVRCHPYILAELRAATEKDAQKSLVFFDKAIMQHFGYTVSNIVRSVILALTGGRIVRAPKGKMRRYFQQATRLSAAFALLADISMLFLGGALKRKESLSARLGDILSYLYLISAILKHYHDQGQQTEDTPLARYAVEMYLFKIQQSFRGVFKNYPQRWLAYLLKMLIFPLGVPFEKPKDKRAHQIAELLLNPGATRLRLAEGAYLSPVQENNLAQLDAAMLKIIVAEPIEKVVRAAHQSGKISGYTPHEQADSALKAQIITPEQYSQWLAAEEARQRIIAVDDFLPEELTRAHHETERAN